MKYLLLCFIIGINVVSANEDVANINEVRNLEFQTPGGKVCLIDPRGC